MPIDKLGNPGEQRLSALHSYNILDTLEEQDFDELTQLASTICGTPIALISLVDEKRQWFKSHIGLNASETPIEQSFCAHAIVSSDDIMIVGDATKDKRFADNPLVTGEPNIVFYAGVPLVNEEGYGLGTLCVIDSKKHELTAQQENALKIIAKQVMAKIESRRKTEQLHQLNEDLLSINEEYQTVNEELKETYDALALVSQELEEANALLGRSNTSLTADNLRLTVSEKRVLGLLADAPVAIGLLTGRALNIEIANDMLLDIWGKDNSVIGKPLQTALPELEGQPFLEILDDVFTSGTAYHGSRAQVFLERNGVLTEGFYNFVYHPIKNVAGAIVSIMVVANDVTSQVKAQQVIEDSERKFRNLIEQAAVAVIVFRGEELMIDAVNPRMLDLLGKDGSINGKPLLEAVPELKGQQPYELLYNVFKTGETYTGYETPVTLIRNDKPEIGYYNFTYTPLVEDGKITGIIDMAVDVTEQVKANQLINDLNEELSANNDNLNALNEELAATNEELNAVNEEMRTVNEKLNTVNGELILAWKKTEKAEATLRLALDAAELGTWYINAETFEFIPSTRLKEIFGFAADEIMPYEAAVNQIAESHREKVTSAVNEAIRLGKSYDTEYPVLGFHDQKERWVKATGKLIEATADEPAHFTGVLMDITERVKTTTAILESEERFRTMAESSDVLISIADESGNAVYFNKSWTLLTGKPMDELLNFAWTELIHPEDKERFVNSYFTALGKQQSVDGEFRVLSKNGDYRWLLAKMPARFREDGSFAGYITSSLDITDQKEIQQRKNDFIGIVSHELKTPLTSMSGYLQMMARIAQKDGDPLRITTIKKASNQVVKMSKMINSFLDVTRLEAGRIHIEYQPFDMAELVKEAEEESLATISTHSVIFAPVVKTIVNADRDKLGQVITNLINNAVKYSADGTTIYVACITKNEMAQVSVKDEGMGIDPEDIDKLFDRFYRVENKQMDKIGGFGIGLYLCAEIIRRHNGKIWVESKPGTGSTFYFAVPLHF